MKQVLLLYYFNFPLKVFVSFLQNKLEDIDKISFFSNLRMGTVSYSVKLHKAGEACQGTHSSSSDSVVSYKESEVL